jgi:GntR family histidine utilization transcriptional repressor
MIRKRKPQNDQLPTIAAPLYEKVKHYVIDKIDSGEWSTKDRLPGEPELSRDLGISRMTVNRALRELATEQVLERIPGVGTFVSPPKPVAAVVTIHNIADDIRARGEVYSCKVIDLSTVEPPHEVRVGMGLRPQKKVSRAVIVHAADGLAVQLERRWVRPDFAPDFLDQDFTATTTTEYLYSIMPPTDAEHVIEAVMPDPETARRLRITRNEPCLVVTRRTWVGDKITSYMRLYHPGSRFSVAGRASTVLHR